VATKEDGPGWSLVFYFRITQTTVDALADLSSAPPAVRLFAQYCQEAPGEVGSSSEGHHRSNSGEVKASAPMTTPSSSAKGGFGRSSSLMFGGGGSSSSSKSSVDSYRGTHTSASTAGVSKWLGRFKIILRCEDIESFGLPSFITAYNSKPVLIKSTGTLVRLV
jgi:hypothetical protein